MSVTRCWNLLRSRPAHTIKRQVFHACTIVGLATLSGCGESEKPTSQQDPLHTNAASPKAEDDEPATASLKEPHADEPRTIANTFAKLIALGKGLNVYAYENGHDGKAPTEAILSGDGQPLLSWRVALLPYIGHRKLYERFDLTEPWDGPTNSELIKEMPSVYRLGTWSAEGKTQMIVISGEETLFTPSEPTKLVTPGGLSNQIAFTVSNEENARIWTQPGDPVISEVSLTDDLLRVGNSQFPVVTVAGTVHFLPMNEIALTFLNPRERTRMSLLDVELKSGGRIPEQNAAAIKLRIANADIELDVEGHVRMIFLSKPSHTTPEGTFDALIDPALTHVDALSITESYDTSAHMITEILKQYPHPESVKSLGIFGRRELKADEERISFEGLSRFSHVKSLRLSGDGISEEDLTHVPISASIGLLTLTVMLQNSPAANRLIDSIRKQNPKLRVSSAP